MDYKFTFEDGSEAIAHHGVKGMKWGVWNSETQSKYQGGDSTWRGAKKTARQLNALDKRKAIEYGKADSKLKKANAYLVKARKADNRGNSAKGDKFEAKAFAAAHESEKHLKATLGIRAQQDKLSSKLVSQGYTVKTRDVRRSTLTKGEKAAQILLNTAAAAAGSPILYTYNKSITGTKYSVKKQ